MGTLGPAEILVILLVALIVLGPERLPEAARKVGQFVGEVRRIGAGFQSELRDAMNVQATAPTATSGTPSAAPGAPPGPSSDVDVAPAPSPPPPARPDDAATDLP